MEESLNFSKTYVLSDPADEITLKKIGDIYALFSPIMILFLSTLNILMTSHFGNFQMTENYLKCQEIIIILQLSLNLTTMKKKKNRI